MHVQHCNQLPNCLATNLENKNKQNIQGLTVSASKNGKWTASSREEIGNLEERQRAWQVLIMQVPYVLQLSDSNCKRTEACRTTKPFQLAGKFHTSLRISAFGITLAQPSMHNRSSQISLTLCNCSILHYRWNSLRMLCRLILLQR